MACNGVAFVVSMHARACASANEAVLTHVRSMRTHAAGQMHAFKPACVAHASLSVHRASLGVFARRERTSALLTICSSMSMLSANSDS
eukprot:6204234-Pleurochrysis_carterae.AAC.2